MLTIKNIVIRFGFCALLLLQDCVGGNLSLKLKEVFRKASPYENYKESLLKAGLESSALGRNWIEAGENALKDSIIVNIPFRETIYFPSEKTRAVCYRFSAKRGETLLITTKLTSRLPVNVFVDMFSIDTAPRIVISSDSVQTSQHEVKRTSMYRLRIQPELLRSCQLIVTIQSKPSFLFPVQGKSGKHIISIFGADRESGIRKHEGIDIVARKGTPVLASTSGNISKVSENSKGGKVVYLTDPYKGYTLYYAHLDTQMVSTGQSVSPGDVIGLVGNTGNALTTISHLHFGLYDYFFGAIDPYHFVNQRAGTLPTEIKKQELIDTWMRTSAKTDLQFTPFSKNGNSTPIAKNTICKIIGGMANLLHVELPDGKQGYFAATALEKITTPISHEKLKNVMPMYDEAQQQMRVAIDTLPPGTLLPVLAKFNHFIFTQTTEGVTGWVELE